MANGLLSSILSFIDQSKQSIGAKAGLLASNPQEYLAGINESARGFNRGQEAGLLADRNMMRGLPVTAEQMRAKQFADKQLEDFALGLVGNIKPVGKTQFDIANEVAQKNAVEMLGLPPNNTAMDRAKAMGFDTPAYHATNKEFNAFDPLKTKLGIQGTFTSTVPEGASKYLDASNSGLPTKSDGGFVMPLMIKNEKSVSPEYFNIQNIKSELSKGNNVVGNDVVVIPESNRIRSRFAAFDPAKASEADLLAAGVPLGLLAGTEVELPKKTKVKAKK